MLTPLTFQPEESSPLRCGRRLSTPDEPAIAQCVCVCHAQCQWLACLWWQ